MYDETKDILKMADIGDTRSQRGIAGCLLPRRGTSFL